MNRMFFAVLLLACLSVAAHAQELETEEEKLSYTFGMDIGNSLKQQNVDIDLETFFRAVTDVYEDRATALSQEEAAAVRQAYIQRRTEQMRAEQAERAATNLEEGQAFLAQNRAKEGVQETESGLQYVVLEEGTGESPEATDTVKVHYRGTLLNGEEFDSSHKRGEPAQFPLNGVIPGWTEGLQLMREGGKYMFYIPPDLAYGPTGSGPIPPNATLIFEVELLEVVDPEASPEASQ